MSETPVCSKQDTLRLLAEVEWLRSVVSQQNITITKLNGEIGTLKFRNGAMKSALLSTQTIMNNSHGIAGWHQNDEIATWGELGMDDEIAEALEGSQ